MRNYRIGIILIGLTLCFSNTSFAQTGSTEQEVEMKKSDGSEVRPKSLISLPQVWVNLYSGFITVQFDRPQILFKLIVLDSNNSVVLERDIISDGRQCSYSIDLIFPGFYTVIITGNNETYYGFF